MESWQSEYAKEYKRTTGKEVTFEYRGGGWLGLHFDHHTSFERESTIRKFTENLQERPDCFD